MHTDVKDPHGQDLEAIISELGLTNGEVKFSTNKIPPEQLSLLYNRADCTINISDAEGFGLSTLESLSCGTPIVVSMTGGLQEQVTNGEEWFGIGLHPSSKAIIGSQDIPYIYEDRLNEDEFVDALVKIYEMSEDERRQLGARGREYALQRFSLEKYVKNWENIFDQVTEEHGSWENRKKYSHWHMSEV